MKRTPNAQTPIRSPRRGVFLAELIITMTLGGLVLMTGIGMLHLLLRTDKTLADSLWRSRTVSQLSQTFREDVHAAQSAELTQPENPPNANEPAPPGLALTFAPDHFVSYSIQGSTLHRTESQGEKKLRAERFRFAPGTEISFQVQEASSVAVMIRSSNPPSRKPMRTLEGVPRRELRIAAVPERDGRYDRQPEESTESDTD